MKQIPLTKGYVALVDDEDYERIATHKWCADERNDGRVYAKRTDAEGRKVYMHHAVLRTMPDRRNPVDHDDGNGCNNQKHNLASISQSVNVSKATRKTSGVRRNGAGWQARVSWGGVRYNLGQFDTEQKAMEAVDEWRNLHCG